MPVLREITYDYQILTTPKKKQLTAKQRRMKLWANDSARPHHHHHQKEQQYNGVKSPGFLFKMQQNQQETKSNVGLSMFDKTNTRAETKTFSESIRADEDDNTLEFGKNQKKVDEPEKPKLMVRLGNCYLVGGSVFKITKRENVPCKSKGLGNQLKVKKKVRFTFG